jgi:protein involved in polysaccharide export with SLBB domain
MGPGKGGLSPVAGHLMLVRGMLALWIGLLAGCAGPQPYLDLALLADQGNPARQENGVGQYRVRCPDVLEWSTAGRPDLAGRQAVPPDGRIDVAGQSLRVDGSSVSEIAELMAGVASIPPAQIQVHVVEFNSQQIYLFGECAGHQRPVPYQGPETVLHLLQRTGGIAPGAAANDVHVVRPHLAEGRPPETFLVDLPAIVRNHDQSTNVLLEPFDEVYIGETRQARRCECMPPCLRPVFEKLCGLRRTP